MPPATTDRSNGGRATEGSPPRRKTGKDGSPPRDNVSAEEKERIEAELRREEIRKEIERLQKEDRKLIEKTAAMEPPIRRFAELERRKGFTYHTWFKAVGSMESMEDISALQKETMEEGDYDIPVAFYSHSILGKVKWSGIRDREEIIDELNFKSPWNGNDFRAIYARWEYTYRVVESVGDVVVNIFEYKAKQPRTQKDRRRGFKNV